MGEIKVKISDNVEKAFREFAMKRYGYQKGSISEAAERAFEEFTGLRSDEEEWSAFSGLKGVLKSVKKSSVALQKERGRYAYEKYTDRRKHFS